MTWVEPVDETQTHAYCEPAPTICRKCLGHAEQWQVPECFADVLCGPQSSLVWRELALCRDSALRPRQMPIPLLILEKRSLCCVVLPSHMQPAPVMCLCLHYALNICIHLQDYDRLADCAVPQASGPSSDLGPIAPAPQVPGAWMSYECHHFPPPVSFHKFGS